MWTDKDLVEILVIVAGVAINLGAWWQNSKTQGRELKDLRDDHDDLHDAYTSFREATNVKLGKLEQRLKDCEVRHEPPQRHH